MDCSLAPRQQAFDVHRLAALRADLLRFARLQLRDDDSAEDMVQESIEAALRRGSTFAGRSTLKTWVFAILRNRIIDHLRQARRTVALSSLVDESDDWQERLQALFDESGQWCDGQRPWAWPDPEAAMQSQQFWQVVQTCLDHLPTNTRRVFLMRECLGFEPEEICSQLGISLSYCHVMLHRARLKLRGCMQTGWGRPAGRTC